ncbi:MAG: IS4 family transposase [Actinomycetota bacterium]|nr:IS4 family transposase [Actinomycetota bacterium]
MLHHPTLSPEDLLLGHIRASSIRAQAYTYVVVASDTSFFNFTSHKGVAGLGPIGWQGQPLRGFVAHSGLALSPLGMPLGLLFQSSWVRAPEAAGQAKRRRERPLSEKESSKWVAGLRAVEAALPEEVGAVLVMDREADLFELFAAPRRAGVEWIIRSAQPRRVALVFGGSTSTLEEVVDQAPVGGRRTVLVHARADQAEREALLSIRWAPVQVLPPRHKGLSSHPPIRVWVVAATEENPPEGVAEPLRWVLLSTLPTQSVEEAWERVRTYALRWRVEQLHFVLKSGCRFERLQVDTASALQKALSLYSVVAWRLLYVLYLSREAPDAPAEEVVSPTEQQVLQAAVERPVQTVAQVVLAVAQVGGFRAYPSAPLPGVQSLWWGFRRLEAMVEGYQLALQQTQRHPP